MKRALFVVALLCSLNLAQQAAPPVSQQISSLHEQVALLAWGGRYAAVLGATSVMRRYGERLASDYTRFDQYLLSHAAELGMRLPAPPVTPAFTGFAPQNFDRLFLAWAATQHQQLLSELQVAVRDQAEAPLADLARALLPLVEIHRQLNLALQQPGAPI